MKKTVLTLAIATLLSIAGYAQSSLPAPGTSVGGPSGGGPGNSIQAPGQQIPGSVGNPWGPGMGNFPPPAAPIGYPNWQNSGTTTVIGAGYDVYGNWYTVPMNVYYYYNGINYNVTVNSAYNPDTDTWDYGLSMPAVNTSYFLRGTSYNFYVPLSFGTFYFNL